MKKFMVNIISIFIILILLSTQFTIYAEKIQTTSVDDELDQQQTEFDIVISIYGNYQIAQSFVPTLGNLTRIQLYLSKIGNIQTNLSLIIRNQISSNDLANMTINFSNVTETKEWIEFNYTSVELQVGKPYYLIFKTTGGNENNSYQCYVSSTNLYDNGTNYYSSDGGTSWKQNSSRDLCFKTFGKKLIKPADLEVSYITASNAGTQINYGITNTGESVIENINILMEIDGGIILTGRSWTNEIETELEPGEMAERFFFPVIGLGLSMKLTLYAWTEDSVQVSRSKDVVFLPFYTYVKPD